MQGWLCCASLAEKTAKLTTPLRSGERLNPKHDINSAEYIEPHLWGISKDDLFEFNLLVSELVRKRVFRQDPSSQFYDPAYDRREVGPSVYTVTSELIRKKSLENNGLSYALMKHPKGLECQAFASHAWVEGVFEFITKIAQHWPARVQGMYVCFLSNPQVGVESLLNLPIEDSPFNRALEHCMYVIVVPNQHKSIYTRLWCSYEAYRAVEIAHQSDSQLTIELSYGMPSRFLIVEALFGLILAFGSIILSYHVLASTFAYLCGPVMWLINGFLLCQVLSITGRAVLKLGHDPVGCIGRRCYVASQIIIVYLELMIWGAAGGCALYHIVGAIRLRATRSDNELAKSLGEIISPVHQQVQRSMVVSQAFIFKRMFEEGEEMSCFFLAVGMMGVFFQHIFLVLIREVIRKESHRLEFQTVLEAHAANPVDEGKLRDVIGRDTERVNEAIHMLKTIGRYNGGIRANIERGMGWKAARDGVSMVGKAITAIFAWQFWWIADMSGRDNLVTACAIAAVTSAAALFLIYRFGDHAIFAVDVLFWMGLVFTVTSNFPFFWKKENVIGKQMSVATLRLQAVLFGIALLIIILFYTYRLKSCLDAWHQFKDQMQKRQHSCVRRREKGPEAAGYQQVTSAAVDVEASGS